MCLAKSAFVVAFCPAIVQHHRKVGGVYPGYSSMFDYNFAFGIERPMALLKLIFTERKSGPKSLSNCKSTHSQLCFSSAITLVSMEFNTSQRTMWQRVLCFLATYLQ